MLVCENVSHTRNGVTVFSGVGFCLKAGEGLTVTGQDNNSKTTLLRILCGLLPTGEGTVLWKGEPVTSGHQDMVYIGEKNALKPALTVYDNIQYWAALQGCEMLVFAALQFFGLQPVAEMKVGILPEAVQRRVTLARLLAIPRLVWVLDNPLQGLDEEGQALASGLIATRLKQEGIVVCTGVSLGNPLCMDDFSRPPKEE